MISEKNEKRSARADAENQPISGDILGAIVEMQYQIEVLEERLAAERNGRIAAENGRIAAESNLAEERNSRIALEGEVRELREDAMRVMVLHLGIILVLELDICMFNFDSVQLTFFSEKCQRGK